MAVNKIILDSNSYTRFTAGDKNVLKEILKADCVYVSVVVLGELFSAFKSGSIESKNRMILSDFLSNKTSKIINVTRQTAEFFAEIKSNLKKAGTPIPHNDMWLAAHALETDSCLVTYDKHFLKIKNLKVWSRL